MQINITDISNEHGAGLAINGRPAFLMGWRELDAYCKQLQRLLDDPLNRETALNVDSQNGRTRFEFKRDVVRVGSKIEGRVVMILNEKFCQEIVNTLRAHARKLEEKEPKIADAIALDNAIMVRSGAPVGLSNNAKIIDLTKKLAASDRTARMVKAAEGVQSREIVMPPTLIHGELTEEQKLARLLKNPRKRQMLLARLSQGN